MQGGLTPSPDPQPIGTIEMTPIAGGSATVQYVVHGFVMGNIVIPAPVVKEFIKNYHDLMKQNQQILKVVQNSKLH